MYFHFDVLIINQEDVDMDALSIFSRTFFHSKKVLEKGAKGVHVKVLQVGRSVTRCFKDFISVGRLCNLYQLFTISLKCIVLDG